MVDQKAINVWTARVVPAILIGIAAYATYTVVGPLCVDYLLSPPASSHQDARPGAATAILVLLFFFLFFMATTYLRVLYTVTFNPGYVPRSPEVDKKGKAGSRSKSAGDVEKNANGSTLTGRPYDSTTSPAVAGTVYDYEGLAQFYTKDVFVCEGNGLPRYCSVCQVYKPDRAHHCREVQRCVCKMDHFCPWVGGIVSETNFKFFVQFTATTFLYCTFVMIVLAYFIAQYRNDVDPVLGSVNIHWAVSLGFAVFFSLFTGVMTGSSVHFILVNTTSVEELSRKVKVWSIAVYLPSPPAAGTLTPYQTITYPLDNMEGGSQTTAPRRTFAILHSRPGENIFDLGPFENWKSVMGENFVDWVLPVKYSPCSDHSSSESAFPLGPAFRRMKKEAGLTSPEEQAVKRRRRRRSRRRKSESVRGVDAVPSDSSRESKENKPVDAP